MSAVMTEWITPHRITVDEYYRMAGAGLLSPDSRVELIEGVIIDMAPIGTRHASRESRLGDALAGALGQKAIVRRQLPLRLVDSSEPQPDLAVVGARSDYYCDAHPTAADTLLVVELSETTLRFDTQFKVPLYARHGVPEVWIVDLQSGEVHFFRKLDADAYTDVVSTADYGVVVVPGGGGVEIDLAEVLRP